MNKDELDTEVRYFIENKNSIGVSIYAVLKETGEVEKLDITADALPELLEFFLDSLNEGILAENEHIVAPLSTSDERSKVFYEYDLDVPPELSALQDVLLTDDMPNFDASVRDIGAIKALLVEIGNDVRQIVLYKTMLPLFTYKRSSLFLIKSNTRFDRIDDDFFRIHPGFQFMRCQNALIVLQLKALEKMFGFHDAIKREAHKGLDEIKNHSILANPDTLLELIEDVTFARKLTKVARNSPVFRSGVENASIVSFCKTFPKLKGKFRFTADNEQIVLDTKVSKNLFVQLLMDNYLTSELTTYHYTSLAKDEADDE